MSTENVDLPYNVCGILKPNGAGSRKTMKKFKKFILLCIIESAIIFVIGSLMNWMFAAYINLLGFVVAAVTAGIVIAFISTMLLVDSTGEWHLS